MFRIAFDTNNPNKAGGLVCPTQEPQPVYGLDELW
jgi:hypothetical protein